MTCDNCRVENPNVQRRGNDLDLCQACTWLLFHTYEPKSNGETQPYVNRRWQFYFHRGELKDEGYVNPGVVWLVRGDKTIGL